MIHHYLFKQKREFKAPFGAEINSIGYMLAGEAEYVSENSSFKVKKGDLVIIPKGQVYESHWRGSPDIEFYAMSFIFRENFQQAPTDVVKKYRLQKIEYNSDGTNELFNRIYRDYKKGGNGLFAAIGEFYMFYSKIADTLEYEETERKDTSVRNAVSYIENNYSAEFSVQQLSKLCGMSESRFYSEFKAVTSHTPIEYKNMVRVHCAWELLANKNNTVEWISDYLNFNSPAYFRKVFRRFTGTTPQEARKKITLM